MIVITEKEAKVVRNNEISTIRIDDERLTVVVRDHAGKCLCYLEFDTLDEADEAYTAIVCNAHRYDAVIDLRREAVVEGSENVQFEYKA